MAGGAPWVLVQGTSTFNTTITSRAFSSAVTAGNLLLWLGTMYTTSGTPGTISDTGGASWTQAGTFNSSNAGDQTFIYWAIANASAADTVSNSASFSGTVYVAEFSGVPAGLGRDGTLQAAQGTTGTAITTPAITTSWPNDLLIAYLSSNGVATPGSPWTTIGGNSGDGGWAYYAPGSAGTFNANWTQSTSAAWASEVVALGSAPLVTPTQSNVRAMMRARR